MQKDKKLEYLKTILKSNGVKWNGKYFNEQQNITCMAKTFDELACRGKNAKPVQIEIAGDVWNQYLLSVNEKTLEVVKLEVNDSCVVGVNTIFKLGKAWGKSF